MCILKTRAAVTRVEVYPSPKYRPQNVNVELYADVTSLDSSGQMSTFRPVGLLHEEQFTHSSYDYSWTLNSASVPPLSSLPSTGDMNFTSNYGLLRGCWQKHDFVQNISGVSRFESRLEEWSPLHAQWNILNPRPCPIAPNQTSAEFGLSAQDPCGNSVGRLQPGHTYRMGIRAISGSGLPHEHDSGWVHSDGIMVDVSAPVKGRLVHVDPDQPSAGTGIDVQASSTSIHVSWQPYWDQFGSRVAFEDREGIGPPSFALLSLKY